MPLRLPLISLLLVLLTPWIAAPAQTPALTAEERLALRKTPVVRVFEQVRDSVVNISSTQIVKVRSPFGLEGDLEDFFDLPMMRPQQYTRTSVGSGFVLHADGYIVTNAHVVAQTAERKVIFADKKEYDAQVVAIDSARDLAVLKIEVPHPLKPVILGSSSDLLVGETVIAIGDPLGYELTLTSGVISALNRSLNLKNNVSFHGLIQTDASINPGNSGGPLLNIFGELVGINTAIRNDAQNIGFAIAVDQLRQELPEMLDVERRNHIITGLRVDAVGPCKVLEVLGQSPADQRGFKPGDILHEMDGRPIGNAIDYNLALMKKKAGDKVHFRLLRAEQVGVGAITLGDRPLPDGNKLLQDKLGINTEALTPEAAQAMGLRGLRALVVQKVEANSPAAKVKVEPGDVLLHIGRYQTSNIQDVAQLLERVQAGQQVPLTVLRVVGRVVYRLTATVQAR